MLKLLKGIFKGLLLLLLACLLLGGLALLAWWAGWPILSVLAVPVLLAAAVVLFWGLRRLWLWRRPVSQITRLTIRRMPVMMTASRRGSATISERKVERRWPASRPKRAVTSTTALMESLAVTNLTSLLFSR